MVAICNMKLSALKLPTSLGKSMSKIESSLRYHFGYGKKLKCTKI